MILFKLTKPDLTFFIAIVAIIAVCVLIYFLTPVIKRKQFEEARQNLRKREETFRANLKNLQPEQIKNESAKTNE
jgi:hypothetical protein